MKKVILILVAVLLVAVIGGGVWFWNAMQQPLYEPGMVRAGENLRALLIPPAQTADKDFWMAEFQVIKDAGHFPFSEQPETFARVVSEFLSKIN